MNELEKKTNEISQNATRGSLSERLKAKQINFNNLDKILILDGSTSMNSDVEPGKSKWNALKDVVKFMKGKAILFGHEARVLDLNEVSKINLATGKSTKMGLAFLKAKELGYKNVLMLTDGEASDREFALNAIEGLNVQIMYIGAGERPEILNELAKKSGSFATTEDLKSTAALSTKIQLLLNPGNKSNESNNLGPICL